MSKLFKNLQNLRVELNTGYESQFALCWESEGMRYHVWVSNDEHLQPQPIIFQNPGKETKRGEAGHFQTRRYEFDGRTTAEVTRRIAVNGLIEMAKERGQFAEARKKVAAENEKEQAVQRVAYEKRLAEQAGPQMLVVLKAIGEFFATNENYPLSPGALLLESDTETIADAVKRVVLAAETGGAVAL